MLTLYEELFLLAIHEEKGTVISSSVGKLGFGLSGAVIAELALRGLARVDDCHRLELMNPAITGDEILDEAIDLIQSAEHSRKVYHWVKQLRGEPKKLRQRVAECLVEKNILYRDEDVLLWVIPYAGAPEPNGSAKYWVKDRLRKLVLACQQPDLHDLTLLSLANGCGLINFIFTKDERKTARRRIYELLLSMSLANHLALTIEEVGAAVTSLADSQ